jgi:NAD(P)-dependent dehydrogenase (short-subunit alcohol dehydrogenase family)
MIGKLNDGASIVNIASLAGNRWPESIEQIKAAESLDFDDIGTFINRHGVGNTDGRSYFFSKEALVVWTMQNRWTWRDRGIRMNTVSPGPVETPILPDFVETLGDRVEENKRVMDRFATPDDVAPVVAFMLSDMSAWIRGSNIPVDGGMSSHFLCQIHDL